MATLEIIIPVYNEGDTLPRLLEQINRQQNISCQVTVVDGGSQDDTVAQARGVNVITAPPGRGSQMNQGVAVTAGEYLLFLHADCQLEHPNQLADALNFFQQNEASNGPCLAGHFSLRFHRLKPGHDLFYRYLAAKTTLNRPDCINGDQGLLIRRTFFQQLGGFATEWPFLEDRTMAESIAREGKWLLLPAVLTTDARRFEVEGTMARQTLNGLLLAARHMGLDEFLAQAPALYRPAPEGQSLDLPPYFDLMDRLLRSMDDTTRQALWLVGGEFVALSAWQPFFWLDVVSFHRWGWGTPCLGFYQRWLQSLFLSSLLRRPMAGVAWLLFLGAKRWFD